MQLRTTTTTDLSTILNWVPTETDMWMWSGPTFTWPLDFGQLKKYFDDNRRLYWTALDPDSGLATGHASLLVDEDAKIMRIGFILLDPDQRGRGLGKELTETAVRAGFDVTNLPAMKLGVYAHNTRARDLYKNLGFEETGVVLDTEMGRETWQALEMERHR